MMLPDPDLKDEGWAENNLEADQGWDGWGSLELLLSLLIIFIKRIIFLPLLSPLSLDLLKVEIKIRAYLIHNRFEVTPAPDTTIKLAGGGSQHLNLGRGSRACPQLLFLRFTVEDTTLTFTATFTFNSLFGDSDGSPLPVLVYASITFNSLSEVPQAR